MKMEILNIQFTLVPLYNLVNISSLLFYYFFLSILLKMENGPLDFKSKQKSTEL